MADIVLRDRSGNPVEYPGIEKIKLNTTGGETVEFVDPALIPESVEKTIDPDFSGGNIVETPEAGTMFSKVIVNKPATLDPKYIAEGVNIAGIVGTLVGGGRIATGNFSMSVTNTINHNMGVVPDIIIIYYNTPTSSGGTYFATMLFGVSSALKAAHSVFSGTVIAGHNGDTKVRSSNLARCIDEPYSSDFPNIIRDTNETTFTIDIDSTTYYYFHQYMPISWVAISGLT